MNIQTRKIFDKSFTILCWTSFAAMGMALVFFLLPIIVNGAGAVFFKATVEHWKFLSENLEYSLSDSQKADILRADKARIPLVEMFDEYENPPFENNTKKNFSAKLDASLAKISDKKNADEILKILESENPARQKLMKNFSEKVWRDFLSYSESLSEIESEKSGQFALEKILKELNENLSARIKSEIAKIEFQKKLSFSQRQYLRRALLQEPKKYLDKKIEVLEEKNMAYQTFKNGVEELLGPMSNSKKEDSQLMRDKYGQPRLDQAKEVLKKSVLEISVREKNPEGEEILKRVKSAQFFKSTKGEAMVCYIEKNFDAMLLPAWTAYWGFFFDDPFDSNIFGGIWPMILGTIYLTVGSMIIAAPLGICAAIYFSEYAKPSKIVAILQMCVGTLAGVPSIVFGLFGLAFLINTLKISESKSVLAGAITLSLLILPTIIRSCEEALKAVPKSYREAALGLGADKWKAICSVILPAALPSMLTGIIISMGRAAGETAPIIFTAATSTGAALGICEIFSQASPALPWNIYNICSEHEMAERVANVQYGMVLTLITIVLSLNFIAIFIRAKLQKKLK